MDKCWRSTSRIFYNYLRNILQFLNSLHENKITLYWRVFRPYFKIDYSPVGEKMSNRISSIPVIVLSGASGFVGRHFIEAHRNDYFIYALARRSQAASDIPLHKNIQWLRVDISNESEIKRVINEIARNGGADFFIHCAAFFNFHKQKDPQYQTTNINGTKYILDACRNLNLKRFIFTSSLAIFELTNPGGEVYNEFSTPNATSAYALSKRECEQMIKRYCSYFPCSILRLAALFSDWCEHSPLYSMLNTWFSKSWEHRFLAGKGNTAIPYLHISELLRLFDILMTKTGEWPRCHILHAAPENSVSHKQLFQVAATYNFFESKKPIFIPKWLATAGIAIKNGFGWIFNKRPFERVWMMKYIDRVLMVDSSYTRKIMNWELTRRFTILRRLPLMICKMKNNPFIWHYRNRMRPSLAEMQRPYLKIFEEMVKLQDQAVNETMRKLLHHNNSSRFPNYQKLPLEKLRFRVQYIYKMLEVDACTGDRSHILEYARHLARERYMEKFPVEEVLQAIKITADTMIRLLLTRESLKKMKQRIYDEIMLTLQMVMDEIEDTYEYLRSNPNLMDAGEKEDF